ncbi:branched-chain amino acid transport system substrate-binding protein [Azospirillum agricola]|uniref:ABC transporter substrate-binding protein n=1 Tax=Azospirillum agricola TaxID=1720247 RepID=UPI001AEA92BD|nr:ABC transporter substrate-binding protein [Azospirillum agricola]MBP2230016.1 branched-chain amino acid transport system substrate-binding protein [Azospirillum agricola]
MFRSFLVSGALAVAAVAVTPAYAQQTVTVGAIEILSGPSAAYGTAIKAGLELALDEINAAGGVLGGKKVALIVEDSAGNKDQAVNAARKLIGRDKVPVIIGPTLSNEMFAVGPVTNERKVVTVGTSTTAVGITAMGPYIFRTSLPESDVVPVTLKTAKEKFGVKTIAMMYANDDAFSKSGFDSMKAAAEKLGLTIATIEAFGSKDSDFSAQLTKIKALNVDAITVSALVEPISGVVLQARQLGIPASVRFIGGNGANSPKLGEIAGEAAEGLMVGSPWFVDKKDALNDKFVADFRKKYSKDPDQFAAQAYDTMHIVAKAIDKAGAAESDKIRETLLKTNHTGAMGPFTFTEGRDPASTEGVVVLGMKGGKFQIIQ